LRFSPDGKRIIAANYPGGVAVVWDVASGNQLSVIDIGDDYGGEQLSLTPDWKTLFARQQRRKVEWVEKDGKRLARWTFQGGVRAWNLGSGKQVRTYQHEPPRGVYSMMLYPSGEKFFTFERISGIYEGNIKTAVTLWDVATGQAIKLPDRLQAAHLLSPDGRLVVVSAGQKLGNTTALKLMDAATGAEKVSIPIIGKNVSANAEAFSPDGRLLVGVTTIYLTRPRKWEERQSTYRWWDTVTGKELASFPLEKKVGLLAPRFSPDGRTLASTTYGGDKSLLLLHDVPGRRVARAVLLGENRKGEHLATHEPAFSPDGRWLAVVSQRFPENGGATPDVRDVPQPRIHLINVATGAIRETLVSPQCISWSVCFSPDGRTLASSGYGRVLLWDVASLTRGK
jgi:WD40 repeat protein